jgi:hypothetical protein
LAAVLIPFWWMEEEEEEKKTNPDHYSIPAEEREREREKKTNLLVEFPVVFVLLFIPLTIRFCAFAPVLHFCLLFSDVFYFPFFSSTGLNLAKFSGFSP